MHEVAAVQTLEIERVGQGEGGDLEILNAGEPIEIAGDLQIRVESPDHVEERPAHKQVPREEARVVGVEQAWAVKRSRDLIARADEEAHPRRD